jgi:EKC/KEOPS complex subunit PCC1/LAGE3
MLSYVNSPSMVMSCLRTCVINTPFSCRSVVLHSTFYTLTVRLARLTLNSFLENVDLVVRTIGQFADDAEQQSASQSHPSA